jgi:hypothetical protein
MNQPPNMNGLPNELHAHIMSFLTDMELVRHLRGVDRASRARVMAELEHRRNATHGVRQRALDRLIEFLRTGQFQDDDMMFAMDGLYLTEAERQELENGRGL